MPRSNALGHPISYNRRRRLMDAEIDELQAYARWSLGYELRPIQNNNLLAAFKAGYAAGQARHTGNAPASPRRTDEGLPWVSSSQGPESMGPGETSA